MDSDDLALLILIVCFGLLAAWILEPRRKRAPLAHAVAARYDDAGQRRAPGMSNGSPRARTLDEIDAREARKRESFASLAMIAPTPEMIRAVMALSDEDETSGDAEAAPTASLDEVHATSPNL